MREYVNYHVVMVMAQGRESIEEVQLKETRMQLMQPYNMSLGG